MSGVLTGIRQQPLDGLLIIVIFQALDDDLQLKTIVSNPKRHKNSFIDKLIKIFAREVLLAQQLLWVKLLLMVSTIFMLLWKTSFLRLGIIVITKVIRNSTPNIRNTPLNANVQDEKTYRRASSSCRCSFNLSACACISS